MLRIAICDDNETVIDILEEIVNKEFEIDHSISKHTTGFALLTYIEDNVRGNLDVIIMDINLGDDNGIDIAKTIKDNYPHIKIVFISGHIDYVKDIFEVEPSYFLVKPIQKDKVTAALYKVNEVIEKENLQTIMLVNKNGISNIKINNIKYIESFNRIVRVFESGNTVRESHIKLDDISQKLPINFLRCHQSYIVNMDRIKYFNMEGITLFSNEFVPVSRPKYNEAKRLFFQYIGGKI